MNFEDLPQISKDDFTNVLSQMFINLGGSIDNVPQVSILQQTNLMFAILQKLQFGAGGGGGAQTLQEVLMGGNVANNQITLTNSFTDVVNKITNDSIKIMGELDSVSRRAIFELSKITFRYDGNATIEQLRSIESHLLFPQSGVYPKVIPVSVNGIYADENGEIMLPINPPTAQSLTDVTTGQGFNETANPFYSFNEIGIKQNETKIAGFVNEGGYPVLFMAQEGNNGNFELRDGAASSYKKVRIPVYTESGDYDLAFNSQIIEITDNYQATNFNSALDFLNPECIAYIPTATTNRGKEFVFINSSEGNCYIQTINDELIGNFFQVLSTKCAVKRDQCITIKSNGIGYKIISKSI